MDYFNDLSGVFNGGGAPVCEDGVTRCVGYDLERCIAGNWFVWEENSTACGYVPPEPDGDGIWEWIKQNGVWLGAGGAALAGVLLLIIPKKK